ncbi:MAG: leucine-rich repeat protein, partial [Lachnospiraceae bacterium]|nr:leucine-rich repeat protein [Lachnospiraceae bacterium]
SNEISLAPNGVLKLDGKLTIEHNDHAGEWKKTEDGTFKLDENGDRIWDQWTSGLSFSDNSSLVIGSKGSLIVENGFILISDNNTATFDISGKFELNNDTCLDMFSNSILNIKGGSIDISESHINAHGDHCVLAIDNGGKLNLDEDSSLTMGSDADEFFNPTLFVGKQGTVILGFDNVWAAEGTSVIVEDGGIVKSTNPAGTTEFSTHGAFSIKLGDEYFSTSTQFGAEKHDFVFDGTNDFGYTFFEIDTEGKWNIIDEVGWWGAPLKGEYKIFSQDETGVVSINGTAASYREYYKIEKGKTLNFKLTPPAGSTTTPIVSIATGDTVYRSDSLQASDYDYKKAVVETVEAIDTLKTITLTNNEFSFTPETDDPIGITIYWKPSEAIISGLIDAYGQYRWMYDLDKMNWNYDCPPGWADPGSEFAVEASAAGSGSVSMTPGFGFYRVGNTVGESYQGGELANGGVDVTFTPASGYDLSYIVVNGIAVSLSNLTKNGNSYTYHIAKIPENVSKYYTFKTSVDYTDKLIKAFLPNGAPVITIEGFFSEIYTPSSDPTPSTSTETTTTPAPEAVVTTTPAPEPETKVTENKDGSTTTTTVVENKDGSTTTTEVVEEKDGTVTTTEVTENKDGSVTTETEIENTDGSKVVETKVENPDGSSKTEAEILDKDGNVLSAIEEEVTIDAKGTETVTTTIENADGSKEESVVTTTKKGKVESTVAETSATGKLEITLGKEDKTGLEVTKKFVEAKKGGIKLTDYDTKNNTKANIPGSIDIGGVKYLVTTIAKNAFAGNETLKKAKLPESILEIGKGAFKGASSLKKIELGSQITKVNKKAFDGIAKKATITIKGSMADYDRIVALIKASGIDASIKFKWEKE